jgi:xylulokinase
MSAGGPLLAAVDVGTTGARAAAIDLSGTLVAEARRPYRTRAPQAGWAEQDAADWGEHAVAALAALRARLPHPERVAGIGLTGQCPTVAPIGADGRPVGPGMLYRDNRAVAEAREMRDAIGPEAMHARTGHVAEAFHIGPKVLWLRRHRPDVYAATRWFLQPRDVVLRRLTGRVATDETHADATLFFDLRGRRWADDLLARFGVEPGLFPEALPSWETAPGSRW